MVILFDRFNLPKNIYEVIFATRQQQIVAKVFIRFMREKQEVKKTEMSMFASTLHDGELVTYLDEPGFKGKEVKLSYNKRQFYDRILTPMKTMGMIYYDLYKKTYKLSDKLNNDLLKIGLMWKKELGR